MTQYYTCQKGHTVTWDGIGPPPYCPTCRREDARGVNNL